MTPTVTEVKKALLYVNKGDWNKYELLTSPSAENVQQVLNAIKIDYLECIQYIITDKKNVLSRALSDEIG